MKWRAFGAAAFVAAAGMIALGQDSRESPQGSARELAQRLFSTKDGDAARGEREDALRALSAEYAAVREAALDVLRRDAGRTVSEIDFRSQLHYALQVVRVWGVREARSDLLSLVCLRIRPGSVPPGIQMAGSSFYPAAEALAGVAGPPDALVSAITDENSAVLLWVMTEAYGRRGTVALLEDRKNGGGPGAPTLDAAIKRVGSVERTSDLLPVVWTKK